MTGRVWAWVVVLCAAWHPPAGAAKTRVVSTKYGQVQGLIRHLGHLLGDVEVFLGVPYASPPVDEGRFTPTNTPTPWDGVLDATSQPRVCPQLLPDPNDSYMPRDRAAFIRRVAPHLANQSEDCLTLSIYTPIMVIPGSEVYPVLVYFHGESFSWGAGSLYDGSVLAAYGRVVVVTINYRLGPLGFLNAYGGGSGGVLSNFALLDQIGALNWVAENIARFSGDPSRVTLFGRDTGAACVSFLMESPIVPPGLFQRVVLLSGWSGCPGSWLSAPLSITLRLAVAAGCPVPDEPNAAHPRTIACLRAAPLDQLMAAARKVESPAFLPAWGPSVDGVVVAGARRGASLGRQPVEVMIGYTPWEAWPWLGQTLLDNGVDNVVFERVARTWVRNTRQHHLREVLAAALQEYTDWTASAPSPLARRDLLLQLLGDAGVVAPLHQAADILARHTKVFMFLCDLANGGAQNQQQLQAPGWELGLMWGTGLSDVTISPGAPSPPLQPPALTQLSEDVITLITNFAKSGDPNLPRESPSPGFAAVAWPRYRPDTRHYLRIGVPPTLGSQYRAHQLALWTWLVPELEAAGQSYPPDPNSWELSHDPSLFYGRVKPPEPWVLMAPNTTLASTKSLPRPTQPPTPRAKPTTPRTTTTLALTPTMMASTAPKLVLGDGGEYVRYSTALLVTVGLGVSLLLCNGLIFLLLFWRRPATTGACPGHRHPGQEGPGTYGGPPDCVKASYEKLHLTTDELKQLTRSPSSTLKRCQSPGPIKTQSSFRSHGVATICRSSPRGGLEGGGNNVGGGGGLLVGVGGVLGVGGHRETSFSIDPPSTVLSESSSPACSTPPQHQHQPPLPPAGRVQSVATIEGVIRASSEPREVCKVVGVDGRPNGWAGFVGGLPPTDVPEPPPPPRASTLRREKKVTILDEAVHRL